MEGLDIDRINELSRKSKSVGLTEDEKAEQIVLRKRYIESFRSNLRSTLENVYVVDEDGKENKIEKKDKQID